MNLNKYHRYINLRDRPDRDILCKDQLRQIGITEPKRFNAFKTKSGIIGCGMSHLSVIQDAKNNNFPYILVCEDDVVFKDPELILQKIHNLKDEPWDVLLLGEICLLLIVFILMMLIEFINASVLLLI